MEMLIIWIAIFLKMSEISFISFIDEIDDDFYHCILLLGATFCDHQTESDKGVVGNSLVAIFYRLFVSISKMETVIHMYTSVINELGIGL